jgi:hypothetical protein
MADRYYRNSGYRYHDGDRGDRDDVHRNKDKHGNGKGVPPGLAKQGGVSPGLQRNQRLPDAVTYEPLPRELDRQMALPSPDYVRVRVGTDLAILNKKTRVVVDFLRVLD